MLCCQYCGKALGSTSAVCDCRSKPKINDGGPAFPLCPGQEGPLAARFLNHVDGGDWSAGRCWEWVGGKTQNGYGSFAVSHRQQQRAHRVSFRLYTGREPVGLVLHRCDNRACVNPMHLEEGSHGENMRQMAARRRAVREERHHKAKLTFAEAVAVRLLLATYTTRELAAMLGMHQSTIAAIANRGLWPDAAMAADAMLAERAKGGGS